LFDNQKRKRLGTRLRRAVGLPDDPALVFLVAQIAKANYPKGSDPPRILVPVIDQPAIARLTADFIDRRVGTINSLFRAIWGMSPRVYLAQFEEIVGEPPK